MEQDERASGWSVRDFIALLRRRKWIVVVAVLVVGGAAVGVSLIETPLYKSSALLLIQEGPPTSSSVFDQTNSNQTSGTLVVQTQMQIITSRAVSDAVTKQLGDKSPSVSVSEVGQTSVVKVTASSTSPGHAAAIANSYANQYIDFTQTQDINSDIAAATQIQSKINDLQKQINSIDAQVAAVSGPSQATLQANLGPQRDNLVTQQGLFTQRLQELQVDASLGTGAAQLVTPAVAPTTPFSPKPLRNAILGVFAGLLLGTAAAYGIDYLDDSVSSVDDVIKATRGLPNLGIIPQVTAWKSADQPMVVSMSDPASQSAEAYRTLRTSIQFIGLDHSARVIQITSPSAEEGKTTTLTNLGVVLAKAGQRVCLCCCDLRRPRVHEFFGLGNAVGLTSAILGERSISAAVQAVPGVENLFLMASGPMPPNPSELLGSPRAAEVIGALAGSFDVVLVDCPPVLPVTDAAVLAGVVDATLLTLAAGATTAREITRALQILNQVHAPIIGTVLNGVTAQTGGGYYSYDQKKPYFGKREPFEPSGLSGSTPASEVTDPASVRL